MRIPVLLAVLLPTIAFDAALGDVDGDGDADACLVHLLDPGTVFLNDGSGNFTPSPSSDPLPQGGRSAWPT